MIKNGIQGEIKVEFNIINTLLIKIGVPIVAQWVKNLTGIHRMQVRSLALLSELRIRCRCKLAV